MAWKIIKIYLILIAFALVSIFLWNKSATLTGFDFWKMRIVSIITLTFFGGGGLFMAYKEISLKLKGKKIIEFTDEGIIFGTEKSIPWRNINGFSWQSFGDMILIYTKNPEQEIAQEKNRFKRKVMQFNLNYTGALYAFSTSQMEGDKDQILDLCEMELKRHTEN